tara:strand:- start:217 stop:714 length:498 start_codon:yes stop_codon:yes gene_type:complete
VSDHLTHPRTSRNIIIAKKWAHVYSKERDRTSLFVWNKDNLEIDHLPNKFPEQWIVFNGGNGRQERYYIKSDVKEAVDTQRHSSTPVRIFMMIGYWLYGQYYLPGESEPEKNPLEDRVKELESYVSELEDKKRRMLKELVAERQKNKTLKTKLQEAHDYIQSKKR